ncbi:MAG TPA: hypothetical protein DCF82_15115, partial [Marinobacter hydrocarbonoclasticus]|nr:hypothetical protein [Marinobacter nauticus]
MAFHNPDPKIREIERDNARLRAEFFAELFGGAWRVFRRVLLRCRVRQPRVCCLKTECAPHENSDQR